MVQTPGSGFNGTTWSGYVIYWVTFGVMAGSALIFAAMTYTKPQRHRKHGYCTTLIVTIAAIAYYAMAAHGGNNYIYAYYDVNGRFNSRQIYWARYVDWFFTTPLLLLDILFLAGVPVGTALWIIVADILMIITGLAGAINTHQAKWGWYAFGCFFQVVLTIGLVFPGMKAAFSRGGGISKVYAGLAAYLAVLWWGYPIVWGLAEGSNTISSDAEVAAYAGLDICAKVFFGFFMMAAGPIITKQTDRENTEGKGLPSVLEASIDSPFATTQGFGTNPTAEGHPRGGLPAVTAEGPNGASVTPNSPASTHTVV